MTLLQAYPSRIPTGISNTNPYLIITVLILVTIILNIRYTGTILSFILGVFTLFFGTDYWFRFGLGPTWAQVTLIFILIVLSVKNFMLSLFKRESILHPFTQDDRYLLSELLDDLRLSGMRKFQALSFWFPIIVFSYFLCIEQPLHELLFANQQKTGTTVIIGLPLLGIVFSVVYFVSITVEEDFIPLMTLPTALPSVEILDIYFNCVIFYLLLMAIASVIGWRGFMKYASIHLISYSFPIVAIVVWRWEAYEALLILLYYFLGVSISIFLLFLLERSKVMVWARSNVKHSVIQINTYIEKISSKADKLPEELSEEEQFVFLLSRKKNWMNWRKMPSKLKTSLLFPLTFLSVKLISFGSYIKTKSLTFKFRPIKQKDEYDSFRSKFIDIYLIWLRYVVILVIALPIYVVITYLLYPEMSIVFIQSHPEQITAIIVFVLVVLGVIYLSLLIIYIIFALWLRKYRTLILIGKNQNWNELTYDCIVEAREYNRKNLINKAYRYLVLGLYYNLMEGVEFVEVNALYKIRKGARLYRRKKIAKALNIFDKISKDMHKNEALKHFGHIYDLIGNYYRKLSDTSIAIDYYQKSQKFNHKVKNWKNVDILERKIKELNI